jgi:phosphoribosyl 1,2-cyclic phosphodiesterase
MMRFASLGSGSKGNATLVSAGDTLLMIDCGFSVRETDRRLARLGVTAGQLDAILVTHEHSDHISGVPGLSRRYGIPVYLTHGTAGTGRCDDSHELRHFNCGDRFQVGDFRVTAVAVPHDAAEPCQYRLDAGTSTLGVLTDLGCITPNVVEHYGRCDGLLLEFNHDTPMLMAGSYPPMLKRRVAGDWGHLNNGQSLELLRSVELERLRHLVVAHVSENNNTRGQVEDALLTVLDGLDRVVFADQSLGFDWLHLA